MDFKNVEKIVDNTLLKQTATWADIKNFVLKSLPYHFRSLVIPPFAIEKVINSSLSKNIPCFFSAVVGFPLGYTSIAIKCYEIDMYKNLDNALSDLDVVININNVKSGNWNEVDQEMSELCKSAKGKILKLIIETPLLSYEEIEQVCRIAMNHKGIHFIKTSTGFCGKDTTLQEVEVIAKTINGEKGIKVSGGVRNLAQIQAFIDVGATIFGSSSGISIIEEARKR